MKKVSSKEEHEERNKKKMKPFSSWLPTSVRAEIDTGVVSDTLDTLGDAAELFLRLLASGTLHSTK